MSVPFLVGTYTRRFGKDYSSLEGLKDIFDDIVATNKNEEICVIRCTKYTKIPVFVIQVLLDIPAQVAENIRENPMVANNIYTTIGNDVSDLNSLVEKLWNIHKEEIQAGYFSAQKDEDQESWRPFNESEQKMIDNL